MYKIIVNEKYKDRYSELLEEKIALFLEKFKDNNEIPEGIKLIQAKTSYKEKMLYTDYSWCKKKYKWMKVKYSKEEYSDVSELEYDCNLYYIGLDAIKGYDIDYEKGKTLDITANTIAAFIFQVMKYKNKKFDITINMLDGTCLSEEEPKLYVGFFEIRDECMKTYKKIYNESMINIIVEC